VEVGDVQVWTPRFEGLDRRAHAAVVDEFRNKNRSRAFVLVSASSAEDGVNVIGAVSESLKDRVKAPELFKRLGLRGGGRPDFAQGGGVAAADIDVLRRNAIDVIRQMLTA
jgi:alanyl-tRNA synthetase